MERKESLADLRKARGLSQQELAEEIGVTRQTVANWEKGSSTPLAENMVALSRVYGMPVEQLLSGKEEGTAASGEVPAAGAEPAASEEKAKPKKSASHMRIWLMVTICIYGLVLIWGGVTKSWLMAVSLLDYVTFLQILGWLLYSMYIVVTHFRKDEKK